MSEIAPPALALEHAPRDAPGAAPGIALAIVNFNTAERTLRCLASIAACDPPPGLVAVLDNASDERDFARLAAGCVALPRSTLRLYRSGTNLGFAAGSNALFEALLAEPAIEHVALLNNDAVAKPDAFARLAKAMADSPAPVGLAGGRMNRLDAPDLPDTLGISIYASLMTADRLDPEEPLLGPTGGCCLLSRALLDDLKAASGYWFDERYFCYCEDTDLALRAVLLGWKPAWVDAVCALHEGQASTGRDSEFIAYHGLRNILWMQVKLLPGRILAKYGILLAAAHAMAFVRQSLVGRAGLMLRVYRDAWARLPEMRTERARFLGTRRRASDAELDARIVPRFYRRGYLGEVLGTIARRWRGARPAAGPAD